MTNSQRQDFRFTHRLRVRWAEVSQQKSVFNAHYLMYFETAMTDYWRALALPYDATLQALQGHFHLKKATVEFLGSARMDDSLDVALKCSHINGSSFTFTGAIFRGDERLVSCELIYVFADPATQTSKPSHSVKYWRCHTPAVAKNADAGPGCFYAPNVEVDLSNGRRAGADCLHHRRPDSAGAGHHFARPGGRALRSTVRGARGRARGADRPGDA